MPQRDISLKRKDVFLTQRDVFSHPFTVYLHTLSPVANASFTCSPLNFHRIPTPSHQYSTNNSPCLRNRFKRSGYLLLHEMLHTLTSFNPFTHPICQRPCDNFIITINSHVLFYCCTFTYGSAVILKFSGALRPPFSRQPESTFFHIWQEGCRRET